jgi:hypothetical protein
MCRPELHDATTREQYGQFHAEMETLGLFRTISRDGKVFRLPSGLYLGENVPSSLKFLGIRISLFAITITGHTCELALWPIDSAASVDISGLEDVTPSFYGALLGLSGEAPPSSFSFLSLLGDYK